MPYLQPATANYFGFAPVREVLSINPYPVSSSEGLISAGDMVLLTSRNTVKTASTANAVLSNCLGVAAQSFDANAGSTTQTNANMCLIYDHPMQLYYASDTSSGTLGSTSVGLQYFVCATGVTGSTGPSGLIKRSVMAISGAVQASSAGNVKIIALHPIENNVFATGATGVANVRKWIVGLPAHIFAVSRTADLLTT